MNMDKEKLAISVANNEQLLQMKEILIAYHGNGTITPRGIETEKLVNAEIVRRGL